MSDRVACPFCREPRAKPAEATEVEAVCSLCGVSLEPWSLVRRAKALEEDDDLPPEAERLPWTAWRRGRGVLALCGLMGLALFFGAPWVNESAPELRTWTGYALAQRLGWMWGPAVAWFVLLPLVLSRRSVLAMRGSRLAVALLATVIVLAVGMRLSLVPASTPLRPVRFAWGWGLWGTGALGLIALATSLRFGGRRDALETRASRRGDEVLH